MVDDELFDSLDKHRQKKRAEGSANNTSVPHKDAENKDTQKEAPKFLNKKGIFGRYAKHNKRKKLSEKAKQTMIKISVVACSFMLLVVILWGMGYGILISVLKSQKEGAYEGYTQIVGDEDGGVYYKHKLAGSFYNNDCIYVSLNEICELFSLTITGDVNSVKVIAENGTAEFFPGSLCVMLGNETITLKNAINGDCTDLYVPLDFFTNYADGLGVLYNEEKKTITLDVATEISEKQKKSETESQTEKVTAQTDTQAVTEEYQNEDEEPSVSDEFKFKICDIEPENYIIYDNLSERIKRRTYEITSSETETPDE